MNNPIKILFFLLLLLAGNAAHANTAGHVLFVQGEVQRISAAGQTQILKKGDAVSEGDTLASAPKSTAQIRMQDGGFIAVRPDTRMKFDQFVFAGQEDGSEKSFFSLFKGGFRAVTGLIGRVNKQNYQISTPAATIGIRGTDHETVVIAPNGGNMSSGTYNMVNTGETSMTTDIGTVSIRPGEGMAFSPGMNQPPVVMPLNAELFSVVPPPAPQAQNGEQEEGGGVRESAVVDNTAQKPATGSESSTAAPDSAASIPQLPITTVGGTSLTGGGGAGGMPPQGQGGITYFSSGANGSLSNGYGDTVNYTTDISGLSGFVATTMSISGTRGAAVVVDGGGMPLGGIETMGWGRWAGAGATLSEQGFGTWPVFNLHYVGGSPVGVMPITGAATYLPVGGTRPTDAAGNVGQFTGGQVSVNFAAASLTAGINLSFGGVAYAASGGSAYAPNGVLTIGSFTTINCTPACSTAPTGEFAGAFVGTNAAGLGLVYHVNTQMGTDIAGAQAFIKQ